ncbi:hypothetical protein VNO78_03424 [Psophocarpus tetragonolobus]|uniref:Protein CHLOROPLAST IMPORT APPARATUS 2 n=1 Tax=Psophocarpus tetragonolobus TaxID=3891 RepID=A0AAN9T141_PSOTE
MSSSCGRTCGFNLDFVKSSSSSTLTSPTSSPSSTTSETINSPQSIFTRKPRTLRKRPNQRFNEAATLLSTAYPNLFSTKNLKKPEKFTKPIITEYNDSSEPLLLLREYDDNDAFSFLRESKRSLQRKPGKVFFTVREKKACELSKGAANCDELEELDCESMLDEEIEEGIDSIMGGRSGAEDDANCSGERLSPLIGGKFGWVRALRRVDDTNRWNFLVVDMLQISPRMKNTAAANLVPATTTTKKKKRKKKVVKKLTDVGLSKKGLWLKLNYDDVRNAWSDRGSPFADGSPGNVRLSSLAGDLKSKE